MNVNNNSFANLKEERKSPAAAGARLSNTTY